MLPHDDRNEADDCDDGNGNGDVDAFAHGVYVDRCC